MNSLPQRRELRCGGLVAALVLGILAAGLLSMQLLPLARPVGQFSKYPVAAIRSLHGQLTAERLIDFSPLYLAVHRIAYRFLPDPLRAVLLFQIALLALAAALLLLVLRGRFGMMLSLGGATALLFSRSVPVYGYVFEPEAMILCLLIVLIWLVSRVELWSLAAAGVVLALCLLTRPSLAFLIGVVPLALGVRAGNRRGRLISIAVLLVPALAGGGYLAARNHQLLGSWSPLVMNPGAVFFDGNSPLSLGRGAAYPPIVNELANETPDESDYQHATYRLVARRVTGRDLTVAEVNAFWKRKALSYLRDNPGEWLLLLGRKMRFMLHAYRWHDLRIAFLADEELQRGFVPSLPFAALSTLALLGMLFGLATWRDHLLMYGLALGQTGVILMTYASDRQRLALLPAIIYFAVLALDRLVRWPWRKSALIVAAGAPLFFFLSVDQDLMRDNRHIWRSFNDLNSRLAEAARLRDEMDFSGSLRNAAAALALCPWATDWVRPAYLPLGPEGLAGRALSDAPSVPRDDFPAAFDRALLLIQSGRLEEAERSLGDMASAGRRFEPLNDRPADPAYHLGRIAALRGRGAEAIRFTAEALRRSPGDPSCLAQLAALTGEARYAERLFRYFDDADALFFLGRACLENGKASAAADYLGRLALLVPEYRRGQLYLAAALAESGSYAPAAGVYLTAIENRVEPVMLEESILPAMQAWAAAKPPGMAAAYWYGFVLRQFGHYREARDAWREAAREADDPAVKAGLAELEKTMRKAGIGP